jgi:hypothetical protein
VAIVPIAALATALRRDRAETRANAHSALDLWRRAGMKTIQIINLDGHPAALIVGDAAIVADHVTGPDRARVQAKAHFALRIIAGELPGPYTDEAAEDYARTAATAHPVAPGRRRAHRRGRAR